MYVAKNNLGISYVMDMRLASPSLLGTFSGSSINRRMASRPREGTVPRPDQSSEMRKNVLSRRSKTKIRAKIFALSGVAKKLTFLTLTFVNKVEDRVGITMLKCFLENAKKRFPSFEYIWVAEKQTKNKAFPNNIHFHIITNMYWEISRWYDYWIELQKHHGIVPRKNTQAGTSAFDVKMIKSEDKKAIGNYIAGYLAKSQEAFDCRIWHCSRKVSRLYTGFYSGMGFINQITELQQKRLLDGEVTIIPKSFCNILLIPLNKSTDFLYEKIHLKNRSMWFD